jgi:hypothetical protein
MPAYTGIPTVCGRHRPVSVTTSVEQSYMVASTYGRNPEWINNGARSQGTELAGGNAPDTEEAPHYHRKQ